MFTIYGKVYEGQETAVPVEIARYETLKDAKQALADKSQAMRGLGFRVVGLLNPEGDLPAVRIKRGARPECDYWIISEEA